MKDLLRLRTSLTEEIEVALNDQIRMEAMASATYLAMSSWCERNAFDYSTDYFLKQSGEEREHMLKLFKYINDLGGRAISPDVVGVQQEFESFRGVFELALEQEISVTQSFHRIMDKCHKVRDYTTATFLQWFLQEQVEEEYKARRALDLFEVIGEEGTGRFEIDKYISKIEYDA